MAMMFSRIYEGRINIFSGERKDMLRKTDRDDIIIPDELLEIAHDWFILSRETGDKGSCVLGAAMYFEYQGEKYDMSPQSPWQGEGSWNPHKDYIKQRLSDIGATDIRYEYGIMD